MTYNEYMYINNNYLHLITSKGQSATTSESCLAKLNIIWKKKFIKITLILRKWRFGTVSA